MAKGSCLCNTVKFETSGEALPMSHCHCSMCRKIHGAMFATYFRTEKLQYSEGEASITNYESSPGIVRSFCNSCGSPLPEKSTDSSAHYVPAGLMDEDPGARPDQHIFTESKADWHNITDSLPQQTHYGDGDESKVVAVAEPESKEGVVTGGCLCGAISFEFTGEPNMMMNCHCSRCRKVKGAAHATNAFVPGDNLTFTNGDPSDSNSITNYAMPEAKVFGHAFCNTCGSSVPRARADGSVYNVPVGSLNQAPGIDAKGHIFVGSKAPWYELTDDLPHWDEMPT